MRSGQCPKCGSVEVGHLERVLDLKTSNSLEHQYRSQELRVLGAVRDKTGILSSETHAAEVEAFVCTRCGFFEEYVRNPGQVPWERLPLFRWHRGDGGE